MSQVVDLSLNFPKRRAASTLRRELLAFLMRERPEVGAPFPTEAELIGMSKLSRSTVRRALEDLQRDGWIERRVGQGTFVGPRVMCNDVPDRIGLGAQTSRRTGEKSVVRLAVLIFSIGDLAHDWYTPGVLEGLDAAAEEHRVTVELLGNRDRDVDAISRRLISARPDVLACLAAEPKHAFVIRDAQKLGIPCLVTGTPHIQLGIPTVCEDNRQGMKLAIRHLVEQGHRKIGLMMQRTVERWCFDRHEAYLEAMNEAGLEADEGMVHWLPMGPSVAPDGETVDAAEAYVRRKQPTAVVSGSFVPMACLDRLFAQGRLRVPHELSVVSFEQDYDKGRWLGGMPLTTVVCPLREMGEQLAVFARRAVEAADLPATTYLSCRLLEGHSTQPLPVIR